MQIDSMIQKEEPMDSVQVVGDTIVIKIDDFEEGEWSPVLTIEK